MVEVRAVTSRWSFALAATLAVGCGSSTNDPPAGAVDSGTKPDTAQADTTPETIEDTAPEVEPDTGADDAEATVGPESCEQPPPLDGPAPSLKDAGLYRDFATKTLKSCWVEFEPHYKLWSDGLVKRRFIWLPPGTKVDVSNMDRWTFPVGTRVFKEFALASGQRVETRLIERTPIGFIMGSYVWKTDGSDATYLETGTSTTAVLNPDAPPADQKTHDVPSNHDCHRCHDGETGKLLGFSAVQLSKPGPGINFKGLAARDFDLGAWRDDPPKSDTGIDYPVPGTPVETEAFGVLHANCGHCHNPIGEAGSLVTMRLRVAITGDASMGWAATTDNITSTTVGVDMQFPTVTPGFTKRVVLGSMGTDQSGMYFRDSRRGEPAQMPPLATKLPNTALLSAVKAWVEE